MLCKKWSHPKMSGFLITSPDENETSAGIIENYLNDDAEPGDEKLIVCEEVEMTQAELDALPEFDG